MGAVIMKKNLLLKESAGACLFSLTTKKGEERRMRKTEVNLSADVVVVGGGIIGLCIAYYLHREGGNVVVVDRGAMGEGCSFANAGLVAPSHFIPLASPGIVAKGLRWMLHPESPFYIRPRLDWNLISWLWKFRRSAAHSMVQLHKKPLKEFLEFSRVLFRDLCRADLFDFEWSERGLLMLYLTGAGERDLRGLYRQARELGVSAQFLTREQLARLLGPIRTPAPGGLFFPEDAHLDPGAFVKGMARYLSGRGVRFIEYAAVQKLIHRKNRVEALQLENGRVRARQVVLAAGSWTPQLTAPMDLDVPVQPAKGYSLTFPWEKPVFTVPMILTETKIAVTPFQRRLRFAGTLELAGLQLKINHRRIRAIRKGVQKYLPELEPFSRQKGQLWAGLRPCTPDGLPIVGRVPAYPNLIIATGHAMIGISLATGTGKVVADMVLERSPEICIHPFRVDRF